MAFVIVKNVKKKEKKRKKFIHWFFLKLRVKLDVAYKKERKKIVPFTKKIWVLSRKKPVKLRACCEKKGNKNGCFHEKIREIGRLGKKK